MIFCRSLNIIFIKTKKVGGTSFEIALSKFCNCDDIVTPISSDDEQVRNSLGYQGPVNYDADDRCDALKNLGITGNFKNHIHSKEIYENIGENLFKNTVKIAIHRDPLDFLISQYFYSIRNKAQYLRPKFKIWLSKNYKNILENYEIAPTVGDLKPDIILRYETLHSDILEANILPLDFMEGFKSLNAKGGLRPSNTKCPKQFFKEQECEDYIGIINGIIPRT